MKKFWCLLHIPCNWARVTFLEYFNLPALCLQKLGGKNCPKLAIFKNVSETLLLGRVPPVQKILQCLQFLYINSCSSESTFSEISSYLDHICKSEGVKKKKKINLYNRFILTLLCLGNPQNIVKLNFPSGSRKRNFLSLCRWNINQLCVLHVIQGI